MSKKKEVSTDNEPESMDEAQGLQEKYMQMQMYDQQMRQLQKYIETFDEQLIGVRNLIDAVNEFGTLKKGDLINAPLANGVFVKARLEDSQHLLVNVGNGVVVSKTIPEVVTMLEGQEAEVKQFKAETTKQMEALMKILDGFD
jgi:prefoldin alpha subunit